MVAAALMEEEIGKETNLPSTVVLPSIGCFLGCDCNQIKVRKGCSQYHGKHIQWIIHFMGALALQTGSVVPITCAKAGPGEKEELNKKSSEDFEFRRTIN
ncbi:hypothetical protein ACET3Z_009601 [Daucus carota]